MSRIGDGVEWFVLEGYNAYTIAVRQGDEVWLQTVWSGRVGEVSRLGDTTLRSHWSGRWDDVVKIDSYEELEPYLKQEVDLLDKTF
jgi:hypothetical protein